MREEDLIRRLEQSRRPLPEGFEARRDMLLQRLIREEEIVTKKKLSLAMVMALILALAAIGAALAAGLGVFGQLAAPYNKEKLEKLDSLSQSYQQSVTLQAEGEFPETAFTLDQGYYDGESLYVSYLISGKSHIGKFLDGKPDEAALKNFEDHGRTEDIAFGLQPELGDAFWSQVESRIEKDGYAYFQLFSQYLGDGAWLDKDHYINPSESDYKTRPEGGYIGYTEFERPLPEAARNKDSVDLYMLIYRGTTTYYLTKDKALAQGTRSEAQLPMHISRADEAPQIFSGTGQFAGYSAEIRVKVSPVEVKADIRLSSLQKDQRAAWDDADMDKVDETMDVLRHYQLYADGKPCPHTAYQASITDEVLEIAMGFAKPESFQELQMVPVYSQSGKRPEEAITLK